MGQPRDRMKADIELKGYAESTWEEYLRCAGHFAMHYMRPPEDLGEVEVRGFRATCSPLRVSSAATFRIHVVAPGMAEVEPRKPGTSCSAS